MDMVSFALRVARRPVPQEGAREAHTFGEWMKFRNTLILLVILAALAAYVLLVDRKAPALDQGDEAFPTPMAEVLSFEMAQARGLRLERSDPDQVTDIQMGEDGLWHILEPLQDEADQDAVTRLLETLTTLRPSRVLTGTVGAPGDYGLDPPAVRAEVTLREGGAVALSLGANNPANTSYYGQVAGDERIYLFPYFAGSEIGRHLDTPPVKPPPTLEPSPTVSETN